MSTMLDITYAVSQVAMHILSFMYHTYSSSSLKLSFALTSHYFPGGASVNLVGYSYADFANNVDDRRLSLVVLSSDMYSSLLVLHSPGQHDTVLSTMEYEYYAGSISKNVTCGDRLSSQLPDCMISHFFGGSCYFQPLSTSGHIHILLLTIYGGSSSSNRVCSYSFGLAHFLKDHLWGIWHVCCMFDHFSVQCQLRDHSQSYGTE